MATLPTGTNNPTPPPLPGSGPQNPVAIPPWWNDMNRVIAFVLALYETDPRAAVEFWLAARKLAGQQVV